jgi:hypothetical protein
LTHCGNWGDFVLKTKCRQGTHRQIRFEYEASYPSLQENRTCHLRCTCFPFLPLQRGSVIHCWLLVRHHVDMILVSEVKVVKCYKTSATCA